MCQEKVSSLGIKQGIFFYIHCYCFSRGKNILCRDISKTMYFLSSFLTSCSRFDLKSTQSMSPFQERKINFLDTNTNLDSSKYKLRHYQTLSTELGRICGSLLYYWIQSHLANVLNFHSNALLHITVAIYILNWATKCFFAKSLSWTWLTFYSRIIHNYQTLLEARTRSFSHYLGLPPISSVKAVLCLFAFFF